MFCEKYLWMPPLWGAHLIEIVHENIWKYFVILTLCVCVLNVHMLMCRILYIIMFFSEHAYLILLGRMQTIKNRN